MYFIDTSRIQSTRTDLMYKTKNREKSRLTPRFMVGLEGERGFSFAHSFNKYIWNTGYTPSLTWVLKKDW